MTVLVTGASRGIGREIALLFAKKGYQGAANYSRSGPEMEKMVQEAEHQGFTILPVRADLADHEAVKRMVQEVENNFGAVDVLVNNAGIALQKLVQDTTWEEWRNVFAINVDGMFSCTQAVLPGMIRRQKGRIINLSSMWGVTGGSCEVAYSASKAAVIGFTKALAKEAGPSGITVNCIAPGVIATQMNQRLSKEDLEALREETPLMKIGSVEDVAEAAFFLASEKAGFITGQVLQVNGGIVI